MKSIANVIKKFTQLYIDTPGVLDIQEDNFIGESIIVFFDRDKIQTEVPSTFEGVDIAFYDVKEMLVAASKMIASFKREKINLNVLENKAMVNYFSETISICEQLLAK